MFHDDTINDLKVQVAELETQIAKLEEDLADARAERDDADAAAEEADKQAEEAGAELQTARDTIESMLADRELLLTLLGMTEHEFETDRAALQMHGLRPHHGGRS